MTQGTGSHDADGVPGRTGPRIGWTVLARWLRVPGEPPTLPPGSSGQTATLRPAPAYLSYLRLVHLLLWGFVGGALAVFLVAAGVGLHGDGHSAVIVFGAVFLVLLLEMAWMLLGYWAIALRYDTTWYVLTDRALRTRSGIWTIQEMTATFENVQNVRVRQGPIQRMLGIGDVAVETAAAGAAEGNQGGTTASSAVIAGIENPQEMRDRIVEQMRRARTGGLGDEAGGDAGSPGQAGSAGWNPKHVAMLREIRQELAEI
ncbi:MAG: PH domain-containing protein [Gemmatimonadota bacterium]